MCEISLKPLPLIQANYYDFKNPCLTLISLAVPISRSFDPKLIDESSDEYKDLANEVLALVRPTFEAHNPIPGSDFEAHVSFSSSDETKSKRKWVIKRKNIVIGLGSPY